jgi:hypothetical protein
LIGSPAGAADGLAPDVLVGTAEALADAAAVPVGAADVSPAS